MRLGTGVFLLALGAILAFAVDVQLSGVDLRVVGWILMAAGALAVVVELAVWAPRRRRVVRTDAYPPGAENPAPRRTTTEETY
jgi:membrane protein implicated in regulation of membrane protease activity